MWTVISAFTLRPPSHLPFVLLPLLSVRALPHIVPGIATLTLAQSMLLFGQQTDIENPGWWASSQKYICRSIVQLYCDHYAVLFTNRTFISDTRPFSVQEFNIHIARRIYKCIYERQKLDWQLLLLLLSIFGTMFVQNFLILLDNIYCRHTDVYLQNAVWMKFIVWNHGQFQQVSSARSVNSFWLRTHTHTNTEANKFAFVCRANRKNIFGKRWYGSYLEIVMLAVKRNTRRSRHGGKQAKTNFAIILIWKIAKCFVWRLGRQPTRWENEG